MPRPRFRPRRLFRTALIAIPLGVAANVILSLVATDRELLEAVAAFPRGYLALALGLALLPWVPSTLRLLVWTRFLGYGLSVRDAARATLSVEVGSAVSPTAVGGDALKWGVLVERGISPGAAASLITVSKLEDAVFFTVALPLSVIATSSWENPVFGGVLEAARARIGLLLLTVAGILTVGYLLLRLLLRGRFGAWPRRRARRLLGRLRRRVRAAWRDARRVFATVVRRGKARFAGNLLLASIQWGARYSVVSALIAFLGLPVEPVLYWFFQWVVFTIMSFVPTPGATGGAEAAFALLYGPLLPIGAIGLATAGWRFLTFYLQVALGALLFTLLGLGRRGAPAHPRAIVPRG